MRLLLLHEVMNTRPFYRLLKHESERPPIVLHTCIFRSCYGRSLLFGSRPDVAATHVVGELDHPETMIIRSW